MSYSEKDERARNLYLRKLTLAMPKWIKKKLLNRTVMFQLDDAGELEILCTEDIPDQERFKIGSAIYKWIDEHPHLPFKKLEVIQ